MQDLKQFVSLLLPRFDTVKSYSTNQWPRNRSLLKLWTFLTYQVLPRGRSYLVVRSPRGIMHSQTRSLRGYHANCQCRATSLFQDLAQFDAVTMRPANCSSSSRGHGYKGNSSTCVFKFSSADSIARTSTQRAIIDRLSVYPADIACR